MSTPKRKRFNRRQRLETACHWLQEFSGRKVARDYRRYFGVDWPTAFKELEILGVSISADYKAAVLKTLADLAVAKEEERAERLAQAKPDQNEIFAFIVGYTGNGVPYGITWDEWEKLEPDM